MPDPRQPGSMSDPTPLDMHKPTATPGSRPAGEERFGQYGFVRRLEPGRFAERFLAVHDRDLSSHVVYRYPIRAESASRRRFLRVVQELAELDHPHLLPIEQYALCPSGRGCIVVPYTGNNGGLLTLGMLLHLKGGRLTPAEAQRSIQQTLEAIAHAHRRGLVNGAWQLDQILIDRHGRVQLELYGLDRRLAGGAPPRSELIREELHSIATIGYRVLTGFRPDARPIAATEVIRRLVSKEHARLVDPRWDAFFSAAFSSNAGLANAEAALSLLPSGHRPAPETEPRPLLARVVGGISDRFRALKRPAKPR